MKEINVLLTDLAFFEQFQDFPQKRRLLAFFSRPCDKPAWIRFDEILTSEDPISVEGGTPSVGGHS